MNSSFASLKEILKNTILQYYPKYFTKRIIQVLMDNKIVTDGNQIRLDKSSDISGFSTNNDKIIHALNERTNEVLKNIEKCEFDKSYTYSILFDCELNPIENMISVLDTKQIAYDIDRMEVLDSVGFDVPLYSAENKLLLIKFNKLAKLTDYSVGKIVDIKIPVLIAIHFDDNIVEVRFDVINEIGNEKEFWKSNLYEVRTWLEQNLEIQLINMDLYTTINYIVENKSESVIETGTKMNLKDNRQAELNSSSSQDNTLPLLGDLKKLIDENKEVFEESPVILSMLTDFINGVIETSNCYWRMLSFNYAGREKELDVKVTFTYKGSNHDLIQFYRPQKFDKEKMNYVIRFIAKCRREAQRT